MAKTKISEWSATPANNTDIDNINIAEGCAPSGINDAIREMMAQIKDLYAGTSGDIIAVAAGGTGVGTSTGSGSNVLSTSPTLVTPALGTPSALVGTNITGTATSFNINGTVGATTPTTGAFTTLAASGTVTLSGGTANGVAYLNGSKVVTSGSALTFDGSKLSVARASNGDVAAFSNSSDADLLIKLNSGVSLLSPTTSILSFGVSNSEQMRLTSTGLGIGTSAPVSELDVRAASATMGNYQTIQAFSTDATAINLGGGISLGGNYSGSSTFAQFGSIAGRKENATDGNYAGYLQFGTNSQATGVREVMRLDSSGNLGIGTSSPVEKVQSSNGIAATGANQSVGSLNGFVADYSSGASRIFASRNGVASSTLELWTTDSGGAANKNATLDASGNLGLGVTPSAWASSRKAIQVGASGGEGVFASSSTYGFFGTNCYLNSAGNNIRVNAGYAQEYRQWNDGSHQWMTTGTSTAGSTITFTQAMTLDASGNLGVGTTSPAVRLDVQSSTANIFATSTTGTNGVSIRAINTGGYMIVGRDTSTGSNYGSAYASVLWSSGAYPMLFATNDTERARIDSSGNLLVGTTSAGGKITVSGVGGSNTSSIYVTGFTDGVGTGIWMTPSADNATPIRFTNAANTTVGSISITSSATLYNVTSDQRLKENIVDAPEFGSVIDSLQVRSFDWKAEGSHQRAGFVAQELVIVAPEAVYQPADPEEMMAVDYSKLVPMLVKEIQSLRVRVAQLESN